ncbi:MAG: hydrogenase nickel incorporation protein HypB [Candidatus Krumholzibacteriia bacterium]
MCDTCGCSQPADAVTYRMPGHDGHAHDHHHHHEHDHGHDHDHAHPHEHERATRTLAVEQDILHRNDLLAQRNRGWFEAKGILALNLVSSPGSGKTTLLERTIGDLGGEVPVAVIEGDQQTLRDADRIAAAGAPVIQVNTGHGCHLDAAMVRRAVGELAPADGSLLMIENVGNLVCPALFDLGEAAKVVIISVTEGDDKPLKYPTMFAAAGLCVINKIDLLPYVDFDPDRCEQAARGVNPGLEFLRVSATTGEGLDAWYAWLRARRQAPGGDPE